MTRSRDTLGKPWSDPNDILEELGRLGANPRPDLYEPVADLLGHADPDVREEALRCVAVRWKDPRARTAALHVIRNDPEEAVRAIAAYALAATTVGPADKEVLGELLAHVRDSAESPHVRGAAYEALLIIHKRPAFPPLNRTFNPEVDIDWRWLGQLG